jgi:hypothetical protein
VASLFPAYVSCWRILSQLPAGASPKLSVVAKDRARFMAAWAARGGSSSAALIKLMMPWWAQPRAVESYLSADLHRKIGMRSKMYTAVAVIEHVPMELDTKSE